MSRFIKASKILSSPKKSSSSKNTPSGSQFPKLVFDEDGYNVTNGMAVIPQEFLYMRCANLCIEFLSVNSTGMTLEERNHAKNHAIFKVDFSEAYDQYRAARISMEPNWDVASTGEQNGGSSYKPGKLLVKPVQYLGESRSTARTARITVTENVTLYHLLWAIMTPGVHQFWFVTINDRYFGCRDFVTQALYQMCQKEYAAETILSVTPQQPVLPANDVFYMLGMRFRRNPPGRGYACPIDKGYFGSYTRIENGNMPYIGSQAADWLATNLA